MVEVETKKNERKRTFIDILKVIFVDSKALKTFLNNFLLAYNIRAGVATLVRLITLAIRRPKHLLSITKFIGENNLKFRIEAVRLGLFIGGFSSIYRAVTHSFKELGDGKVKPWHSAVGGWAAGLSLCFMDKSWHRTLALYMSTRGVQCLYNYAKLHGYWHFWGSSWNHGDSLLFTVSCAQIMYSYVMRPSSLPKSYYKFIVRQGPIDETVLQAVRDNCRGKPINLPQVRDYVEKTGGKQAVEACKEYLVENPRIIPSRILHPFTSSGIMGTLNAFTGTAKRIFPVYLSLALVPAVVLRFKSFASAPGNVLLKSLLSAGRSTTFLATFCSGYMGVICVQRFIIERLRLRDHKLTYFLASFICSLSILIERKSRRSELALYCFPRAADALYLTLYDHKLAFHLPYGELLMFCTAMSSVMWFYANQKLCLSPLVTKLLDRFITNPFNIPTKVIEDKKENKMEREKSTVSLSDGFQIAP